ncbi:uncharacterized protein LOC110837878 isoform X1 [Zootermopsis nevadensis]|uniref:uncharacterized protein LOC110837878 isoform X1 n=1 Tax=Zootermopsis nevadensis TaxID=136037 RepID=UPI000B8E2D73|nr:uncharacterized protein LOC110837878 isoform X1 [Zootermopsis nevadensis]
MPYRMSQMKKCETLLLEHVDAVVNLLNGFMLKDISSQRVLQRLDYLYNKLNELLIPKLRANHGPTNSDPWQQAGRNVAATKDKEFESPVPSMRAVKDVEYVCGLCKSPITIYNSDHKLSMDLHYQDDIHQKAVEVQKMRGVRGVIQKPAELQQINKAQASILKIRKSTGQKMKGSQTAIQKTDKHIDQLQETDIPKIGKCTEELLKIRKSTGQKMKGSQTAIQKTDKHIDQLQETDIPKIGKCTEELLKIRKSKGQLQKMTAIQKTSMPTEINCKYISQTAGKYHCCLCNMNMHSQKCVQQHVVGTTHQRKMAALQMDHSEDAYGSSEQSVPLQEDKFWSKIPEGWRNHMKHFVDSGATTLHCSACSVIVPKTTINVLSHIRGKKHCHISSDGM